MSLQPPAPATSRRSPPAGGRRARQSGFSLLETAVVIALIGFIALLLPRLLGELGGLRQLAEGRAPEVRPPTRWSGSPSRMTGLLCAPTATATGSRTAAALRADASRIAPWGFRRRRC